jgi:hypothetical protein
MAPVVPRRHRNTGGNASNRSEDVSTKSGPSARSEECRVYQRACKRRNIPYWTGHFEGHKPDSALRISHSDLAEVAPAMLALRTYPSLSNTWATTSSGVPDPSTVTSTPAFS